MSNSNAAPDTDKQDWEKAAEKAKEAAALIAAMAVHAASAVGTMATSGLGDAGETARQTVREVGNQADELTANAGIGIQAFGNSLNRNAPDDGLLRSVSEVVASAARDGGEYLEHAKFTGIVEDVTQVIRRNPLRSVLVALGVGWFLGRRTKG